MLKKFSYKPLKNCFGKVVLTMKRHSKRRDDLMLESPAVSALYCANMKTRKVKASPSKSTKSSNAAKKFSFKKEHVQGILLSVFLAFCIATFIVCSALFGAQVIIPWVTGAVNNFYKAVYNYMTNTTPIILDLQHNITKSKFQRQYWRQQPLLYLSGFDNDDRLNIINLLQYSYSDTKVDAAAISNLGLFKPLQSAMAVQNDKRLFFFQSKATTSRPKSQSALEITLSSYRQSNLSTNVYNPFYVSDSNILDRMPKIKNLLSVPELFGCDDTRSKRKNRRTEKDSKQSPSSTCAFSAEKFPMMLTISQFGNGMSFHMHGDSWSELIYGRKRWFLYKPGAMDRIGFDPAESTSTWSKTEYLRVRQTHMPLEVIQEEGQVLYIPEGWYHASITSSEGGSISITQNSRTHEVGSHVYYLAEALAKGEERDYEAAIKFLELGLKVVKDPILQATLAEFLERYGLHEEAEKAYKDAIVGNYKNPGPYINLVRMWENSVEVNKTAEIKDLLKLAYSLGVSSQNDLIGPMYEKYQLVKEVMSTSR